MVKNKWLTKFIIFVFLLSTFSSSALVVPTGYAEGDNDNSELVPDSAQTLEFRTNSEIMDGFFHNPAILLEKNGKKYIQMSGHSGSMIKSLSVDGEKAIRTEGDNYTFQFELKDSANLSKELDFHVDVEAGFHKQLYKVKLWFDESTLEDTENNYKLLANNDDSNDSSETDNGTKEDQGSGSSNEDVDEDPKDPNSDEDKSTEPDAPKEDNDDKKPEIEEDESESESDEILIEDGAYTLSYSYEGANISGSYENPAILIQEDGKQYIQLQGKSMRQFVEYLYIDGEKMDIGPAIDDSGAYFAQYELTESIQEKNTFTFNMIINARGMLMDHKTEITFDLESLEKVNEYNLVEDTTEPINTSIVESDIITSYAYTTEGANISRNYEDTIEIIEKDDKQYLQLNGSSMRQFVDALYIDGERMNIGEAIDESGAYKAQIELTKPLSEKNEFDFVMLINARGNIMMHETKIIVDVDSGQKTINLADGDYLIGYDALYQDKDDPSTAAAYLVNPTKLSIQDGKAKLFIKLTDHEVIKDLRVEQDDEFVSAEVVSTNEEANTRIVAFELDNLTDEINAQVEVYVEAIDHTEEPFFRIVLHDNVEEYDGSLEKDDPAKPTEFEDGLYTINYRVLEEDGFKKSYVGNLMEVPADLKIADNENTVTISLDDSITDFQIEKDGQFEKVTTDGDNNITFEIDSLDAVVKSKVTVESEESNEEVIVFLHFEENRVEFIEALPEDETPEEKEELIADEAYLVDYTILEKGKDNESAANRYFTGEAVLLKYNDEEYAQITTTDNSAQYFNVFQSKLNGKFEDMVEVERTEKGAITFQFKLDNPLVVNKIVELYMEMSYGGKHEADLVFDTSNQTEANPEDYLLMASINANGPDGEDAQDPGIKDPAEPGKEDPEETADEEEEVDLVAEAYTVDYTILEAEKDSPSIANNYFTGEAVLLKHGNDEYVQITTENNGGEYIKSFRNKIGEEFVEMVEVETKNGEKTLQFKLDNVLTAPVQLDMHIVVPDVYDATHEARLVFDTSTIEEANPEDFTLATSTNANGPDGENPVDPEKESGKGGGTSTPPSNKKGSDDSKQDTKNKGVITPEKASEVDYIIMEAEKDSESVANMFFSGVATILQVGDNKYAQITTQNNGGQYIKSFRNKVNGKYQEMVLVEEKNGEKTLQFKLDGSLSDVVYLDMVINVPGVYENMHHEARLIFDPSTEVEVDPANYTVIPSTNDNGPEGKNPQDPENRIDDSITKPGFGDGKGNGDGNAEEETTNPKTSDTTAIVMYSLLLVAAATGLFFQLRRRFAKQ